MRKFITASSFNSLRTRVIQSSRHDRFFVVIVLLLLVLIPLLSLDSGINGDEYYQVPQTKHILDFYTTLGEDRSIINEIPGETPYYYGKLFEFINALTARIFGIEETSTWTFHHIRHVLIALFGVLLMLFTGLTARVMGGARAGWLALLIIALSPRIFGHALINVKDIPFAAGYIIAIYFMLRFFRQLPVMNRSNMAGIIIGIGISLNMRIGGLLLIAFFAFFTAAYYYLFRSRFKPTAGKKKKQHKPPEIKPGKFARYALTTLVLAYFAGLLFWPYALLNPIKHPIEALRNFTHWQLDLKVLFEGKQYNSHLLPWYYIPKYILITTPVLVITGWVLFTFRFFSRKSRGWWFRIAVLLVTSIFPVAYTIIRGSNTYDGWRHFLFIYPPLAVIATLGWNYMFDKWKAGYQQLAIGIVFTLLAIFPVKWIIESHPLSYSYFNSISGGVKSAFANNELDYYMIGMNEAMNWLIDQRGLESSDSTNVIATNALYSTRVTANSMDLNAKIRFSEYENRAEKNWDYAIFTVRFLHPQTIKSQFWPPPNTIHTVEIRNQPVALVLERQNRRDFIGFQALENQDLHAANRHFRAYLESDPHNEVVLMGLAYAQVNLNNLDSAMMLARESLEISPDYVLAMGIIGLVYQKRKQYDKAVEVFQEALTINNNFPLGHFHLADTYMLQKKYDRAAFHYRFLLDSKNNWARNSARKRLQNIKKLKEQ